MSNKPTSVLSVFIAILAAGCGGIGFAYEQHLVGELGLAATDTMEQMSVVEFDKNGSATGLIGQTVFSVGWDQDHIVAKRHPSEFGGSVDKSRVEYFIVSVTDKQVHGPFNDSEFHVQRKALSVSESVDFSLTFDELK